MYVRNTKQLPVSCVENEFENHVIENPEVHKDFQHVFKCGVGAAPTRGTINNHAYCICHGCKEKAIRNHHGTKPLFSEHGDNTYPFHYLQNTMTYVVVVIVVVLLSSFLWGPI